VFAPLTKEKENTYGVTAGTRCLLTARKEKSKVQAPTPYAGQKKCPKGAKNCLID